MHFTAINMNLLTSVCLNIYHTILKYRQVNGFTDQFKRYIETLYIQIGTRKLAHIRARMYKSAQAMIEIITVV